MVSNPRKRASGILPYRICRHKKMRASEFASIGRLAVFVGAGVSSIPPTSLPSWWGLNRAVVVAMRDRVADLVGRERADALADLITARQEGHKLPPEYQAEVIVHRLHDSYFEVLQVLDSEIPNATHIAIAALAKEERVSAVITTNFDRAIEAAFRECDVAFEVCYTAKHFQDLAVKQRAVDGGVCPILKLHGSAEDPSTLVDTLSQRKRGFPTATAACLRHLLRSAHWLFLGYSGADLEADENYLYLKPDAGEGLGFTWLVRSTDSPLEAVIATCAAYEGRSEIVRGELPGWLATFSTPLLNGVHATPLAPGSEEAERLRQLASARVARHATAWAAGLRFDNIVLTFAALLEAVSERAAAIDVVQRLYDTRLPEERESKHFALVASTLANLFAGSGDFDRAVALFQEALAIFDPVTSEEQHIGALINLALVHNRRGRTSEARDIYQRVLAFAEKTDNRGLRGLALHNLGIIHQRTGEQDEAERLYNDELAIVKALGDEPAQASALSCLGDLAASRF